MQIGSRIGAYEVIAKLGEGGMGEVYRARDTNLGRAVAIKILPDSVAGDAEREARFQREAHILASLNHPHIAAIYGLEQSAGTRYLVLELVDGETLAQQLARRGSRGLPVDEAIGIARQIAEALQAAHDKGIIHRDLKPANIALTADGQVKVLDFGLAKFTGAEGAESGSGNPSISLSPTLTVAGTQAGMILGTAAYMSPEQAKGRIADKRCDIWGFGCVLFEMLTGRRPFEGEDISDTLAAILRGDPDWALLPAGLPPPIRSLVEGCLKKDRAQRIGDIAVARFLLNQTTAPAPTAPVVTSVPHAGASRVWQVAAAALALVAAGAAAAAVALYRDRPVPEVTRFLVTPPENGAFVTGGRTGASVAISPDGRRLAYTARGASGKIQIWLRAIDALTAQPLPGTENAEFPFWSPDSRSLAYFANGKLFKIDAGGGPPLTLCDAEGARGGTWGQGGIIVFGGGTGRGLQRVPEAGGTVTALTTAAVGDHRFPAFIPGTSHLFFHVNAPESPEQTGLYVVTLESPEPKRLTEASTSGVYAAPGVVLFARQSNLLSQTFDPTTLSLIGEAFLVAEHVESGVFGGVLSFSVSETGILAYGVGAGREAELQLTWFDRQGRIVGSVGPPGNYVGLDLSHDDTRVVVHRHDPGVGGDLWVVDLVRNTMSRLTFDPAHDNSSPVWAPDGQHVAFASLRSGSFGLYVKAADGTTAERPLGQTSSNLGPKAWSPDGNALVYETVDPKTRADVFSLPLAGDRKPLPLLATPFTERNPSVSPDGRWLAYSSDESGTLELYVRQFPTGTGRWQVSSGGGVEGHWRSDSKELFYRDSVQLGWVWAVDVKASGLAFATGPPRKLFERSWVTAGHRGPMSSSQFAVSRDGQRFLMAANPVIGRLSESSSQPIAVVTNWAASLRR